MNERPFYTLTNAILHEEVNTEAVRNMFDASNILDTLTQFVAGCGLWPHFGTRDPFREHRLHVIAVFKIFVSCPRRLLLDQDRCRIINVVIVGEEVLSDHELWKSGTTARRMKLEL